MVHHNGRWHVFASTTNNNGAYSLVYLNFTDWAQAGAAQHHYLDQTAIGTGYKAAPQVFYFAPQQRWFLVYEVGDNATFSTTTDISNPSSWSAPQRFYAGGMPQIIRDNIGNGYRVDFPGPHRPSPAPGRHSRTPRPIPSPARPTSPSAAPRGPGTSATAR
ncbi:non-reducing end alpha-L-arabinofuranosidase family hydrolase [Nonomuraea sp. NPDC049400]|uniref:non-reducing end alpha-L-arabinofuranosidase family hydrolase n=1 Tax=Nonomuraea sp. NPDC049400 TaxID=3364352 RepID=UPI00378E741B